MQVSNYREAVVYLEHTENICHQMEMMPKLQYCGLYTLTDKHSCQIHMVTSCAFKLTEHVETKRITRETHEPGTNKKERTIINYKNKINFLSLLKCFLLSVFVRRLLIMVFRH